MPSRTVRGVRQSLFPFTIVGRLGGRGAAQQISLDDLSNAMSTAGAGGGAAGAAPNTINHYDIACFVPGLMSGSQFLLMHRFSKAVTFPVSFGAYNGRTSQAGGSVVAAADTVVTIKRALTAAPTSFSSVGSITIAAGTVTPTFASGGVALHFAQGDVIQLVAPGSPDANLSDFYATLVGFET